MDFGVLPTGRHRQISATAARRALAGTLCLRHVFPPYAREFLQDWQKTDGTLTFTLDRWFGAGH